MEAQISYEAERGCGYRKPSKGGVGIYLVAPSAAAHCGRFPIPLGVCPCCSAGIKPSRSWTWIEPLKLFAEVAGCDDRPENCARCYAGGAMPTGKHGLLWIGEKFYKHPQDFVNESLRMGISRKLSALPRGLVLGETVVYLAHRFAVENEEGSRSAGVFAAFKPRGVDLVIANAQDVPERATKLAAELGDAARIIQVVPESKQTSLPMVEA